MYIYIFLLKQKAESLHFHVSRIHLSNKILFPRNRHRIKDSLISLGRNSDTVTRLFGGTVTPNTAYIT